MSGIQTVILNLKEAGFPLILLWLLTLSIVYGILSHVKIPKSVSARGVISIVAAFMVLFAAASGGAVTFIENIITAGIVIAFGLILIVIFLEMLGIKSGEHVFHKQPLFFAGILIILVVLIFIGAGGLGILNLPTITLALSDGLIAMVFFLLIMVAAIALLIKTEKKG